MSRKSSYTEEQIIRALKEVEAGAKPAEVCRRLGVTEKTFYRWRAKFGGMAVLAGLVISPSNSFSSATTSKFSVG